MITEEPSRARWNYAIFAAIVILLGATVAVVSYNSTSSGKHSQTSMGMSGSSPTNTPSTASPSRNNYPNGKAYLNLSAVYAGLGYPKMTYSSYSTYLPNKPNFTMEYQTARMSFQVGSVGGDVISLDQAVGIAAEKAGLNPSNYTLAEGDFEPGVIVNSTLSIHPEWILFFAQIYDGYWLWGTVGNSAVSVQVTIDALNGTAHVASVFFNGSGSYAGDFTNGAIAPSLLNLTIPASGRFKLTVNSSEALAVVRNSNVSGVPKALSADGSVTSIAPRIVLFGPSSNNEAFMNPFNSSLDGHYDICWVITMFSPTPQYGYQGTFAVDAQTGQLISGWAQALYPSMQIESVTGSLDYARASSLLVSQEAFQIDGRIVGSSGSLPVTVPNVIVVEPGSTASIGLNFSSSLTQNVKATLSFANPLPGIESLSSGGIPQGVSLRFQPQALVVPGNGSASTQILISIAKSAPSATYLVEVDAALYDPQWAQPGTSGVAFLFTVWNGIGQWPPPPIIK